MNQRYLAGLVVLVYVIAQVYLRIIQQNLMNLSYTNELNELNATKSNVIEKLESTEGKNETFRGVPTQRAAKGKMNVVFIMVDDMRAQISPYDGPHSSFKGPKLHTPNLERLASKSLLLKNFFVQYSLCGPSRTSMLTSRRPDTTGVVLNDQYWREGRGNFTTLPQYFKENGYYSMGVGKIFHIGLMCQNKDMISWSRKYAKDRVNEGKYMEPYGSGGGWLAVTKDQENETPLRDTVELQTAQKLLRDRAPRALTGTEPFFLAVGFNKPHLSLVCPKEFFDLYPRETQRQFLTEFEWQEPLIRKGCNLHNATFVDDFKGFVPHETLRIVRQAYFACISYIDKLIGELLDTIEDLGLARSTIVSFVADHGYHLGENGIFGKQTLLDVSTRVPMMMHIPGVTDSGIVSDSITEGVDLFPTIVEAAGLGTVTQCPNPSFDMKVCTEGKSFLSLAVDPKSETKDAAITQLGSFPNEVQLSMRTKRFRYTVKVEKDSTGNVTLVTHDTETFSSQLYDHFTDPQERFNIKDEPRYALNKRELEAKLDTFLQSRTFNFM